MDEKIEITVQADDWIDIRIGGGSIMHSSPEQVKALRDRLNELIDSDEEGQE